MTMRRQRGFTLIEMVIAFAILGIALTVLFGAFESSLTRSRHDAHLNEGTLIAQSLLDRIGTEWPLGTPSRAGEWEGYSYQVDQQPTLPDDGQASYTLPTVKVTASVSWPESAEKRTIIISTLKLLPRVRP
jgi:general secretion pathway protein I